MQYYSLYAFLSQTRVRTDQEVEKGEIIGEAGYYPESKGPGLYFELRQRQTPIDPRSWLAKR
jgi:septal ring factor EnvC (AmiA/AmiB activator)